MDFWVEVVMWWRMYGISLAFCMTIARKRICVFKLILIYWEKYRADDCVSLWRHDEELFLVVSSSEVDDNIGHMFRFLERTKTGLIHSQRREGLEEEGSNMHK
jgi:hypothetical protein